ncbi:MAG: response regulator transcription factor [Ekhidna sp.]
MLLDSLREVGEVHDVENGKEALDRLDENRYDLILLDLEMPVLDGWEASKKIVARHPDVKIIMISMHDSLQIISDLIEIGVHSYLLKNAEPEEVHRAIMSVTNNDFYYNQLVSKALHKKVQQVGIEKNQGASRGDISPREVEVLQLICQELTMKEISEKLFLSEQTVHTHRKNLMKKTKAKNAVGLVKFAFQCGIASF